MIKARVTQSAAAANQVLTSEGHRVFDAGKEFVTNAADV